jgi:hypothetical protein
VSKNILKVFSKESASFSSLFVLSNSGDATVLRPKSQRSTQNLKETLFNFFSERTLVIAVDFS